jgi:hypothetical protein
MERIERGWRLGVLSMQVVVADGALAALVVLGGAAGLAAAAALFVPAYLAYDIDADWLAGIFAALGVFVTTTISVFFGVALAAASAEVLDGKDATVRRALGVAWARLGVIMGWAVVLVTVNVFLQLLRGKGGLFGAILARVGEVAWALATFLVVPILAFEGLSSLDALSRSARLFRERWGEQVTGQISISLVFTLIAAVPLGLVALVFFTAPDTPASVPGKLAWTDTRILLVAVAVVVIVLTSILASAARAVFSVALYRFAVDGAAVGPFGRVDLDGAVRRPQPWRL